MKRRADIKKWPTHPLAAAHAESLRAERPEGEFQVRKRRDGYAVVERVVINATD